MTSEFVSLGHPDKTADFISSYILDRYIERDPFVRYAVEVLVKDNKVVLGGEVTSTVQFLKYEYMKFVREALNLIGYTHEYAVKWGAGNSIDPDTVEVQCFIGAQSPDIARGVDADGWGDQGIFWGMATTNEKYGFRPVDHYIASEIGDYLYTSAPELGIGLDIKTQVEVKDGTPVNIIVAAPMKERIDIESRIGYVGVPKIINGTGTYVRHSSYGDCGITGRKLAVDFYGGNCRLGGGSPWTKDATKADLTLNLYARKIAMTEMFRREQTVYCAISCCIGRREIGVDIYDEENRLLGSWTENRRAEDIIRGLDLRKPTYAERCRKGLFYDITAASL